MGAQADGEQQDVVRNENPERFHVPSGDGRPRRRDQTAVQPVPAADADQQSDVSVDRPRAERRRQRHEKGHGRVGVRIAGRGRGQTDAIQTVAGRRCVLGRAADSQVRRVLLPGRGQQTAAERRQAARFMNIIRSFFFRSSFG